MVSLADLVTAPDRAKELPVGAIPALLVQVAVVQAALAARLLEVQVEGAAPREETSTSHGGQWITVEEAATIAGLSRRWFYQHKSLPFVRQVSRKAIRISEPGLRRWMQKKP